MPISELTRAWLGSSGTGIDLMIYGAFIVLMCVYEPEGIGHGGAPARPWRRARAEGGVMSGS